MSRYAVIMAGGSGTRFWPRSTAKYPKQFLALTSKKTMIQLTASRLDGLVPAKNRLVVCTKDHTALVKKQVKGARILAEPEGRNTMAAVCWSAWEGFARDKEAILAVLPADAHIADVPAFKRALAAAFETAEKQGRIVCLGIKPTFAATGYGYIQAGSPLTTEASTIGRFIEKPTQEKAREFLREGNYLWNAGIFVFKAQTFIEETRTHAPEFARAFDALIKAPAKLKTIYKNLPKAPVDKALMEKTSAGAVIPGDFGWNDVGSWEALADVLGPNANAGHIQATGGFATVDSSRVFASLKSGKFLGLVGVQDLVIVETEQALLVCHKDKVQDIKLLVEEAKKSPKGNKTL